MKYYYAIFKHSKDAVEVEFPDLAGCVTFGSNRDEALENATDVLAAWLANAEFQFVKKPSSHQQLKKKYKNDDLIPIALDEQLLESYEELKRFNVIFPSRLLKKIDDFINFVRNFKGNEHITVTFKDYYYGSTIEMKMITLDLKMTPTMEFVYNSKILDWQLVKR